MLPSPEFCEPVSLAEGNTPLVPICAKNGRRLLLKNESVNPTWSWKDRPNSVSVTMARAFGLRKVGAVSTGNHGNAAAAYASAARLEAAVFCHADAPPGQVALMMRYGAHVTRGGDREALLGELIAGGDCYPCSILCPRDSYSNPYGIDGFKTIAFEIVEQLKGPPDRMFVPVGSGDGIYGVWKGFRELAAAGAIARAPRMIACQAEGADSTVRAFRKGGHRHEPLDETRTVALSIAEKITGDHALRAVYESWGEARSARDDEILAAADRLARAGFALEPASAAALACAEQVIEQAPDETWVIIGSGAAVKWPDYIVRGFVMPAAVGA